MLDDIKRFLTYWSTWVMVVFTTLGTAVSQGLVTMPVGLTTRLSDAIPWLQAYEAYLWLGAFLVAFYKARVTPQGVDLPKE